MRQTMTIKELTGIVLEEMRIALFSTGTINNLQGYSKDLKNKQ